MCDKPYGGESPVNEARAQSNRLSDTTKAYESHTVYELKQQREYHLMKLVAIQNAIEAINKI